jgi:hypothetical protein
MGVRTGRPPFSSRMVFIENAEHRDERRASSKPSFTLKERNPNSIKPSRRYPYSAGTSPFTLPISSESHQAAAASPTSLAPATPYSASGRSVSSPAPFSTKTRWPA